MEGTRTRDKEIMETNNFEYFYQYINICCFLKATY